MRQHHITDETNKKTRKTINNLSLHKSIIIRKALIQSGTKRLCVSCAKNDALEATLRHSAQAAQRPGVHIEKFKAQRKEI